MKKYLIFTLILSLIGSVLSIHDVEASGYKIPDEVIVSGDGSAEDPYIVDDEDTNAFLLQLAYRKNGLIQESDGMIQAMSVSGTETLTKILTGKAHKKQTKGGYWLYKSKKPNVKYNGMIWMRQVQYVSYSDTKTAYRKLTDKEENITLQILKTYAGLSFSTIVNKLVKKGIAKSLAESILKLSGLIKVGGHMFTAAELLKNCSDIRTKAIYKKAVTNKKGMLQVKFMTSYQGQWYAQKSTEVWTNYPTVKEPLSDYGKGNYTNF